MTVPTGSSGAGRPVPPVPPVWLGPGAVTNPAALARFGQLVDVPVVVGPVDITPVDVSTGRGQEAPASVHALGVGGVDHEDVAGIPMADVDDRLRWISARGLSACLSIRGASTGALAAAVEQVRRGLDADVVSAVEVDLRTADDQTVLKSMARVREAAPRGQRLLARLSVDPAGTDLVVRARAAVAGGATAVVVCGQVRLGPTRWWSGPSTAALCRAGLRALTAAAQEQRWPGVPLIASGGVHSASSAVAALRDGAAAVQLGTALWADPTLLWPIQEAVLAERAAARPSLEALHRLDQPPAQPPDQHSRRNP